MEEIFKQMKEKAFVFVRFSKWRQTSITITEKKPKKQYGYGCFYILFYTFNITEENINKTKYLHNMFYTF